MPRKSTDARTEAPPEATPREEGKRRATDAGVAPARESARKGAKPAKKARPEASYRRARQVALVGALLGCAFTVVALYAYHPEDPAFFRRGGDTVHNLAGPAGAWLADILLHAVGYGAWAVLVAAVLISRKLAGRPLGGALAALGWGTTYWALLAALGLTLSPAETSPFPAGGLLGQVSADQLRAVLGPVGAWLAVVGTVLLAAPFAFGVDWEQVAHRTLGGVERGLPRFGKAGLVLGQRAVGGVVAAGAAVADRVRTPDETSEETWYTDEEIDEDDDEALSEVALVSPPPRAAQRPEPRPAAPEPARAAEPAPAPRKPLLERLRAAAARVTSGGERASTPDATQPAYSDLVEVEWESTEAGLDDLPPSPIMQRLTGSVSLHDDEPQVVVMPRSRPQPPEAMDTPPREPAARPKARVGMAGAAAQAVRVMPGALESGGGDDLAALIARPANTPYEPPHMGLLDVHERELGHVDEVELHELARTLEAKLSDFGVNGEVVAIRPGPVITTFEYQPAAGVKISRISSLSDDIAMALKALRVRIVAPIPGKGVVGIEIPNKIRQTVWLRDLFACDAFRKGKSILAVTLGKSVEGQPRIADLAAMPHLLVGGTTGSGKSVGVNAMLLSMLFTRTPDELKLILIDPKMLEFELYRDIPHLLHPVVTDPKLASAALKWACTEMDARYALLSRWQTRNIEGFNKKVDEEMADWTPAKARRYAPPDLADGEIPPPPKKLPYIVIVIDELADLMMVSAKDVEESIIRIAQKARAAGIHLIVATQRPSVNVITGLIKANMPSRIAFQVRTKVDGRTILDQNGAENLLGKGDMLFLPPGVSALERLHGPFVTDEEVRRVTDFLRAQGPPNYEAEIRVDDEDGEAPLGPDDYDELYDAAVRYVAREGKASASMIQREFKIGYNRASRMIEIMEREGVVGQADGARPREVLVNRSTA